MAEDEYGFDPDRNYTVVDNPFWDGTDAAHPAWWRGQERGVDGTCEQIRKILDGEAHGPPFHYGSELLSEIAQRTWELKRARQD